jgi:hypothetical protein
VETRSRPVTGGGRQRQPPQRTKKNQGPKPQKRRKTKTPRNETKTGERRDSTPRRRSDGNTKNQSKSRLILHQVRPKRAKPPLWGNRGRETAKKGKNNRPGEKTGERTRGNEGRREAADGHPSSLKGAALFFSARVFSQGE